MGCKFGSQEKEEEKKNEIRGSVYDIVMEGDNKTSEAIHNLDYCLKKEQQELNGLKYNDSYFANYSTEVFKIINRIRAQPNQYADFIEDSMDNIIEEGEGENKKIIFKKQIKVALNKGEPAFRKAANKLREYDSLPSFIFKNEICVPLPSSGREILNTNYLKQQVANLRQTNRVDGYFKEMVKAPDISALLMIVDDNGENSGKRRMLLMSNELKYIGISSGFVGGTFVAYFVFSR